MAHMSRIVVDLEQLASAALLGDGAAAGAAGVAYSVNGLAAPDAGRVDSSAQVAAVLQQAGAALRAMSGLVAQDVELLRSAAARYAAAESVAAGGPPCA